jgi:hypothetical protein
MSENDKLSDKPNVHDSVKEYIKSLVQRVLLGAIERPLSAAAKSAAAARRGRERCNSEEECSESTGRSRSSDRRRSSSRRRDMDRDSRRSRRRRRSRSRSRSRDRDMGVDRNNDSGCIGGSGSSSGGSSNSSCPDLSHCVLSRPLLPATRRAPRRSRFQRSEQKHEQHEQVDELKTLLLRMDVSPGGNPVDVAQLLSDMNLSEDSKAKIGQILNAPAAAVCQKPMVFGAQNPVLR